MEGYIGEIRLFAGNFAPRNWSFCAGQVLAISSNEALFSIIGCTYGGDCRTTFALPDLRGRTAIGPGQGPGLPDYREGQKTGSTTVTLTVSNLPSHNHIIEANNTAGAGTLNEPQNAFMGAGPVDRSTGQPVNTRYASTANTQMNANALGHTGGSQPFNNMQPSLAVYYIICQFGIFPSRG